MNLSRAIILRFGTQMGKSSGVYFIQLATDNYIDSQKVLFLK